MRQRQPAVYLMASKPNGMLYAGVTSNLVQRAHQHRTADPTSFAGRYGCTRLVYFEVHETMEAAIIREKQIKAGSRMKKLALIEAGNPHWRDLYKDIT